MEQASNLQMTCPLSPTIVVVKPDAGVCQMEQLEDVEIGRAVKTSFRRRLSGCFRKQDSNEQKMLQTISQMDVDSEDHIMPKCLNSKPWYKKATNMMRQRSVSEERRSNEAASGPIPMINKSSSTNSIQYYACPINSQRFLTASEQMNQSFLNRSDFDLTSVDHRNDFKQSSFHGMPTGGVPGASAENLIGRVLREQGLGKYIDPTIVRTAQRELAEAFNMTPEGEFRNYFIPRT